MSKTPRVIRVMSQNMREPVEGSLTALTAAVEREHPDLLLLQHMTGLENDVRIWELGEMLKMEISVGTPGGSGAFAVAWNPREFERDGSVPATWQGGDGFEFRAVRLNIRDFRFPTDPLVAVSCSLSRFSAPRAAQQAQQLGDLAHSGGGIGVIAGAINYLPPGDEQPDWEAMPAYRRMALCKPRDVPGAPWIGDDQVGRALQAGGIADVAGRHADLFEDQRPVLRGATVKEPRGLRADQIHVTSALASTVDACWRVETEISGHHGLAASLELSRLDVNGLHYYL